MAAASRQIIAGVSGSLRSLGALRAGVAEARSAAALDHPHILPIYDFGDEGDLPYIVMPLVSGGTLAERLQNGLPLERAIPINELAWSGTSPAIMPRTCTWSPGKRLRP